MEKICVYTCITGNYDNIEEIQNKEKGIDYYLFTNNKNIKLSSWKVVYIENEGLTNHRLARKIKIVGHPIINNNYDISVWMDGSVRFQKSIKRFVSTYLKDVPLATFKHYLRNSIYEEAKECIRLKKDKKDVILNEMEFLKSENYPENNGLCETTVVIRRVNDEKLKETMQLWLDMIMKYSLRDQLSFNYCVWKTCLKIYKIPLNVWNNDWFYTVKHSSKKKLTTCRIYYGDDREFNPMLDDQPEYKVKENIYTINSRVIQDTDVIEIELTDVPVMEYKDLKIIGLNIREKFFFNSIEYKDKKIFYNSSGMLKLIGDFKKGEKFQLSICLRKLEDEELYEFLEYICDEQICMKDKLLKVIKEKDFVENELFKVTNSRSWKITKPLRKFK